MPKGKTRNKGGEKKFQQAVVAYARMNGWMVYYTYDSRRSPAGFPDLTMIHIGMKRLVAAELKVGQNKRTLAQVEWGIAFESVGAPVEYYEWHQDDWPAICDTLRRPAK